MKLTSITFTGIDERTDIDRVQEISEKYPYIEWGVLLSYHWQENGNRYPNPAILDKLEHRGLRLSAHLCGQMARDVADGETRKMYETINWNFDIFRRCQLNTNVSARYKELRSMRPFDRMLNEVILQMNGGDSLDSFLRYCEKPLFHVAYLLDASGGRGINTPTRVFDNKDIHIGYAGGINPDNVGEKLKTLLNYYSYGKFWIDMESGVRTEDDWLDLDKVQQVLDVCAPLIAEHDRHRQPKYYELKKQDEQKSIDSLTPQEAMDIAVAKCFEQFFEQGEQKPFDYEHANIQQRDFAPKQEPKFKVGDWVVYECGEETATLQITEIVEETYVFSDDSTLNVVDEDTLRLWDITKDAKDGDMLSNGKMIVIFKHFEEPSYRQRIVAYIGLDTGGDIQITDDTWTLGIDKAKPATKEQRDFLFQKMHEVGYTFDFEKKELKKLKFRVGDEVITENEESLTITRIDEEGYWSNDLFICDFDSEYIWDLVEQEPIEWKQENREELSDFENAMMHIGGSFFGKNAGLDPNDTATIREQAELLLELAPKQKWSEEDEKTRKDIIEFIKRNHKDFAPVPPDITLDRWVAWLEKQNLSVQNEGTDEFDEDYKIGTYFSGLILAWVNQPSALQPAHRHHGKNVVAIHLKRGGFRCCCIDDDVPRTIDIPENTLSPLGGHWKPRKAVGCGEDNKAPSTGDIVTILNLSRKWDEEIAKTPDRVCLGTRIEYIRKNWGKEL